MNNTQYAIKHCAIVILAAGVSKRLGSPKQLLVYKKQNLLRHAVDTALETGCLSVFVVLGANMELLKKELKDKPAIIIENKNWEDGMASSIRAALQNITATILQPDSVIFMVCDQPFVNSSLLLKLLATKQQTGLPIVASSYAGKIGTPALFDKSFFAALMELKGDKGAGKLISDNADKAASVSFPKGETDIDTTADYELLKKENDY
ncbi:nucleotidyltransferase family protein [Ferruginibacter sp.]